MGQRAVEPPVVQNLLPPPLVSLLAKFPARTVIQRQVMSAPLVEYHQRRLDCRRPRATIPAVTHLIHETYLCERARAPAVPCLFLWGHQQRVPTVLNKAYPEAMEWLADVLPAAAVVAKYTAIAHAAVHSPNGYSPPRRRQLAPARPAMQREALAETRRGDIACYPIFKGHAPLLAMRCNSKQHFSHWSVGVSSSQVQQRKTRLDFLPKGALQKSQAMSAKCPLLSLSLSLPVPVLQASLPASVSLSAGLSVVSTSISDKVIGSMRACGDGGRSKDEVEKSMERMQSRVKGRKTDNTEKTGMGYGRQSPTVSLTTAILRRPPGTVYSRFKSRNSRVYYHVSGFSAATICFLPLLEKQEEAWIITTSTF
ncbi:hypothetical protein C8R47DRAFT_1071694 [Mycena vitilis]|nr:hypothetical protein C8R47DRAFT_1071694 [Mycena vitilis]